MKIKDENKEEEIDSKEKKESKKEESDKEKNVKDSEKKETKAEKKSKNKNSSARTKLNRELHTLVDLIDELNDTTDIFLKLSRNNLLTQYEEERIQKEKGGYIQPSITRAEFNKILK